MTSSKRKHETKHILLDSFRSKHSLVMKFDQFVILQKKTFYQKIL